MCKIVSIDDLQADSCCGRPIPGPDTVFIPRLPHPGEKLTCEFCIINISSAAFCHKESDFLQFTLQTETVPVSHAEQRKNVNLYTFQIIGGLLHSLSITSCSNTTREIKERAFERNHKSDHLSCR